MRATVIRWLLCFYVSCLLSALAGCSSGSTTTSAPAPPIVSVPAAKPKFAYTGNEGGSLSGYSVDPSTGALASLSGFPLPLEGNPTIITHDPQNRFLFVADNGAFVMHVFSINSNTGALNEISPSPYSTMIQPGNMVVDPSGTHLYLYRTGGSDAFPGVSGDQISAYTISSAGTLSNSAGVLTAINSVPLPSPSAEFLPSTGIAIDTAGKFLYLQDILNTYTFSIDGTSGGVALLQTTPSDYGGGIALDPAGTYLYAAVSNSLLSYSINSATGMLTLAKSSPMALQSGTYTLALSPNGSFAYTIENNNYLVSYAITAGAFAPVGTTYPGVFGLNIAVDPSGSFVYVPQACISINCSTNLYNVVHQFSIANTGALTPLAAPTVASGVTPFGITVTSQ